MIWLLVALIVAGVLIMALGIWANHETVRDFRPRVTPEKRAEMWKKYREMLNTK